MINVINTMPAMAFNRRSKFRPLIAGLLSAAWMAAYFAVRMSGAFPNRSQSKSWDALVDVTLPVAIIWLSAYLPSDKQRDPE